MESLGTVWRRTCVAFSDRNVGVFVAILLLCLGTAAGKLFDDAAYAWRDRLIAAGWDLDAARFYSSLLLFTIPLSIMSLAISATGARILDVGRLEMGIMTPKRSGLVVLGAVLFVPVMHGVLYGLVPNLESMWLFHRFPTISIGTDFTFSRLSSPQSINRLIFSWSIISVAEEIFFRGVIDTVLIRRVGRTAGIAAGAALFALSHWRVQGGFHSGPMLELWIYGAAFGAMKAATGSLMPSIISHAGTNLISNIFAISYRM